MRMRSLAVARLNRFGLLVAACLVGHPAPARAAPLTQGAYVWQRAWPAEVVQAVRAATNRLDAYVVLAAQVGWTQGLPVAVPADPDYAALARIPRPVGLAVRMDAPPPDFAADPGVRAGLARLIEALLRTARGQGLRVAELQLDVDCPESRLAAYAQLLQALRPAAGGTPLAITALPCWLGHPHLPDVLRAVDGFVLQVHSLERPQGPDQPATLCDPARARAWVAEAARLGVPFRVALPTYSYLAAFTATGDFAGVSAEGPRRAWEARHRLLAVRAEPEAMAALADALCRAPPPHLQGLLWYRLPVAGERWNWSAETFAAVVGGEPLRRAITLDVRHAEPGLADVVLANTGNVDADPPASIDVTWVGAPLVAADGLAGYRLTRAGDRQVRLRATASGEPRRVAAGGRQPVAWLRFEGPAEVRAHAPVP